MLIDLKASKGSGIGAVRRIKKQHLESPLNFESEVRARAWKVRIGVLLVANG
jgi:hypothetical protein